MQTFSQRYGYKPVRTQLQFESMDDDLRNSLWNCLFERFLKEVNYFMGGNDFSPSTWKLIESIWREFYKLPLDEISTSFREVRNHIKEKFYNYKWNTAYDFIQFIIKSDFDEKFQGSDRDKLKTVINKYEFIDDIKNILKREAAAYTVIKTGDKHYIAPITNELEIESIESAISDSMDLGLNNVSTHLRVALEKLADKQNPDYRNSIKESISAVEAICRIIADKPNATLGDALKNINDKIFEQSAFKEALNRLYGFASDVARHAKKETAPVINIEDARFMLVWCSAFLNYLIVKANKAGINLGKKDQQLNK